MKKSNLMSVLVLVCICLVSALLLSTLNLITTPWLEDKNYKKTQDALREIYPGGSGFTEIDLSEYELPKSITAAYSEASGGFVIQSTVKGYASGLVIMCGIDKDGKIVGADYIATNETNSAEVGLGDRFVGKVEAEMTPDIVAGPTSVLTTGAYYSAILDAFSAFTVLKGGRTPDQIFRDNCNLALGISNKSFERWFATEILVDVDCIYKTDSADDGAVVLIGEKLIGVKAGVATSSIAMYDEDGVITAPTAEEKATAEAAYAIYSASTLTDVDAPAGISNVLKVSVTATGNYVIDMVTAKSYSINGLHGHGEEKIYFSVSITAGGEIIDVITTKHSESGGYGDVCGTEAFYASIRGANREDILDLNFYDLKPKDVYDDGLIPNGATGPAVIANATFTTVYYQQALLNAFDVVTALLGSN